MTMSSYFTPLVTLPAIITAPGSYRTRCGDVVRVDSVSTRHDFGCKGSYAGGPAESWHKSGRLLATSETRNDIVAAA